MCLYFKFQLSNTRIQEREDETQNTMNSTSQIGRH